LSGWGWSLAWASDEAGLARSSPATQAGWVQPEKKTFLKKKLFQKSVIFPNLFTVF
jgi:hypothetical protein